MRLCNGPMPRSFYLGAKMHRSYLDTAANLRRIGDYRSARAVIYRTETVRLTHHTADRLPGQPPSAACDPQAALLPSRSAKAPTPPHSGRHGRGGHREALPGRRRLNV